MSEYRNGIARPETTPAGISYDARKPFALSEEMFCHEGGISKIPVVYNMKRDAKAVHCKEPSE